MTDERTVRVLRSDATYVGKQGLTYALGVTGQTAGSRGLCVTAATMPPGARARAHYHDGIDTAGYMVAGESLILYGERLERAILSRAGDHFFIPAGRDYTPDIVADIAAADEGAACPTCGVALRTVRGVEIGQIFKLGTRYTAPLGATYLDEGGQLREIVMGCYGIGVGRLLACLAEEHRDDRGLVWPATVAPFDAYLVGLDLEDASIRAAAEAFYHDLLAVGVDVLYDDRDERAGVKFNDADLIGPPLRLTLGRRALAQGAVEVRDRKTGDTQLVPLTQAAAHVRSEIARLKAEVLASLREEALA